jgi:epsilon-lactone hydrolase
MLTRKTVNHRSLRSRFTSWFLKRKFKPRLTAEDFDPARFRIAIERDMAKTASAGGVRIEAFTEENLCGEWQIPENVDSSRCILYCHGGGYLFGSPKAYQSFTTRLAKAARMPLFSLDYRLAPEHPFPAATEDAMAAYQYLQQSYAPDKIVLAGDSAGGGLVLSLLHQIKQLKLPMPAGAVVLSPYADLRCTSTSLDTNSRSCAMFSGNAIRRAAAMYLQGADASDPAASPVYADYEGFPPLRIYLSDTEVLRDDGMRVAETAATAGVPTDLRIWRGQPHVWPLFVPVLPEANQTLEEMAEFCAAV